MSAISDILWPGMRALEPSSRLGGILARKPGYHNSRDRLPATDYSVAQFAVDRRGPAHLGSAIDWTFPDAQAGDYTRIATYSRRLLSAGRRGREADPRTVYMREFFGNADTDTAVEGWDYARNRAASSDDSHLWHIHISIHRQYIDDPKGMDAILSILKAEPLQTWLDRWTREVAFEHFTGDLPILRRGDSDEAGVIAGSGAAWVRRPQRQLRVTPDGHYGRATAAAVDALGTASDGSVTGLAEYIRIYAMWGATEVRRRTVAGAGRPVEVVYFDARLPVLKAGDTDAGGGVTGSGTHYVRRIQRALKVDADGDYGPVTTAAVAALRVNDGRTVDLEVYAVLYGLWGFVRHEDLRLISPG